MSEESKENLDETGAPLASGDLAAVERLKDAFAKLKAEMGKVIVGQQAVLEELLIAILHAATAS